MNKRNVILVGILIVSVFILVTSYKIYEDFKCGGSYLNYKSKSFDSERQAIQMYGEEGAWTANPSKMFSAEQDGIAQAGGDLSGGFLGKTMKYY